MLIIQNKCYCSLEDNIEQCCEQIVSEGYVIKSVEGRIVTFEHGTDFIGGHGYHIGFKIPINPTS